jgi:hypothetical protein
VANINDLPSGSVTIDNATPLQGDTLTVSHTLADPDGLSGAVSYQWLRGSAAISGATGTGYTTVQADVDQQTYSEVLVADPLSAGILETPTRQFHWPAADMTSA